MAVIGIRELARETRKVLDRLEKDGEPVIVARHGKPVAVLAVPTREQLVDADLAATPDLPEGLDEVNRELAEGKTKPFDEVLGEIKEEEGEKLDLAELVEALDKFEPLVGTANKDLADWVRARVPIEYVQRVQVLNACLVKATLADSLEEALGDVQSINEELASIANGPSGFQWEEFVTLLKAATAVKRAERHGRDEQKAPVRALYVQAPEEIA